MTLKKKFLLNIKSEFTNDSKTSSQHSRIFLMTFIRNSENEKKNPRVEFYVNFILAGLKKIEQKI